MPELVSAPLADTRAAVAAGRVTVSGRYWAVLILAGALYAGAFLADVTALGATDWDWHAHPMLAAWYGTLIICGFWMQLVVCAWAAQTIVDAVAAAGRGVRRAVSVVSAYTRRL